VGFLTTALIGLLTIEELWKMLGEENKVKENFIASPTLSNILPPGLWV
jgi:hypothetical protein